jgi:restriction system protein
MEEGRSRWDRKKVQHRHHDALSELDPLEFERLMADYYREQSYEVEHNGTGGKGFAFDGGVDLRLRKDGKLTLVQCKRDTACQTEHNVVNELLGIKINEGADEAIVITTGEFTAAANRFGRQGHVQLIDGVELRQMLGHRLDRLPQPSSPSWAPRSGSPSRQPSKSPSPLQAMVERFAWQAVDHVADRYAPRRRSRARESIVALLLLKVAGVGLVLLMGFVFIPALIKSALAPLAQPRPVRVVQSVPAPPSSVHRDEIPVSPVQATPTVRSAAEQAQRDAEAKAYLERVPELTHYRYPPLDANEDPPADAATPAH